jgi:hypothetical protein
MKTKIVATLCALAVTTGSTLVAQQTFIPAPSGVRRAEEIGRPTSGVAATRIVGSVIDYRQKPVAFAHVQLRNLILGILETETTANGNGEYEFTVDNPSTYVVEMVVGNGNVVALSNAGSVGRYETMQTLVQVPGHWDASSGRVVAPQYVTNYFGMSSEATMTAATLRLANDMNIATSDPGEPVSP